MIPDIGVKNMHTKFESEIPKKIEVMPRKQCHLQTDKLSARVDTGTHWEFDRRTNGRTDKGNPVEPQHQLPWMV